MMHKKFIALLFVLMILVSALPVLAEGSLAMMVAPSQFSQGSSLHIYFTVPKAGAVNLTVLDSKGIVCATLLSEAKVSEGANELTWDGTANGQMLAPGAYVLHLSMDDLRAVDMDVTITEGAEGVQASFATEEEMSASVEKGSFTPAYESTYTLVSEHEACYWCTPMDIHDEAAVWAMLTAPMTIVDGNQKQQIVLREEPNDDSKGVGVVTYASQGVHVLETRDDGWSLVECYSSSFHDSKVKAWNLFVRGYIKTGKLIQKKPAQDYGIVIDKLTQELYLFKDGHLFTTLLASTGLYNDRQPYNETRSGEFLTVSRVGEFRSDNMFASMALRFNGGDLLHEVPHVKNADGTKNFKNTEYKLGTRASHGCIRVQRIKNDDGVNMTWLWDNLSLYTRIAIWEDYAGRQMEIPDSSITLYYNPDGGSNYHLNENCRSVKSQYLPLPGTLTYGELSDAAYQKLTACLYCMPPRRVEEINEINEIHLTQSPGAVPQHLRQDK